MCSEITAFVSQKNAYSLQIKQKRSTNRTNKSAILIVFDAFNVRSAQCCGPQPHTQSRATQRAHNLGNATRVRFQFAIVSRECTWLKVLRNFANSAHLRLGDAVLMHWNIPIQVFRSGYKDVILLFIFIWHGYCRLECHQSTENALGIQKMSKGHTKANLIKK